MLLVLKQVHPKASISNKARGSFIRHRSYLIQRFLHRPIFHHACGSVSKKVRKETYSSYIYQGESLIIHIFLYTEVLLTVSSPQTGPSRYWYLQQSENDSRTGQSRYWYLQQSDSNSLHIRR